MSVDSVAITFGLEKAPCRVCGQTVYRFNSRERWKHVIEYRGLGEPHVPEPSERDK